MTKNGGRIWAHDWENSVVDALGERISQTVDNRQIRVLTILRSVFFSLFCRSLRSPPHAP